MYSEKCKTCANKGTGWCGGCEHNFPGVDQFDFYQGIKEEDPIYCEECKTCISKGTGWCGGCSRNFPGDDQYDFYKKI